MATAGGDGWTVAAGVANSASSCLLFRLVGLVRLEPAFQQRDRGAEVVVLAQEQVDVVEVFLAAKTVGKVVAWVDGGQHFAAVWAQEAEVAFAHFRRRPLRGPGRRW